MKLSELKEIIRGIVREEIKNSRKPQKEVAPPGMEDVVRKLKKDPSIDSPFAVAWSIYNKKHGEG